MNPFDFTKAFTGFWSAQAQTLMKVQEQAGQALAGGFQGLAAGTLPAMPNAPADLSTGAADLARASQSMMALWSAATAMFDALATKLPSAGTDTGINAVFGKIADPRQWMSGIGEMDGVLSQMAEGPRFADMWEVERRYARVLQAWMQVRRRGMEHNAVVLEGWLQAGRRFTEKLAGPAGVDALANAPDGKAAMTLWTETANTQLIETQRSEPFLQTQRETIRASTELRLAQQDLVEHFGKQYGFPTRIELDDVHRTVTELRRELRAMRRDQRAADQARLPAPAADPAPAAQVAPRTGARQRTPRP